MDGSLFNRKAFRKFSREKEYLVPPTWPCVIKADDEKLSHLQRDARVRE